MLKREARYREADPLAAIKGSAGELDVFKQRSELILRTVLALNDRRANVMDDGQADK
jgi:hypothetical protein